MGAFRNNETWIAREEKREGGETWTGPIIQGLVGHLEELGFLS